MVKKTRKLAHCGIGGNYPRYSLYYAWPLERSTITVRAIRESPLPFPVSFNPTYATGAMILVIFLFRLKYLCARNLYPSFYCLGNYKSLCILGR
jgi:hypothetical protein